MWCLLILSWIDIASFTKSKKGLHLSDFNWLTSSNIEDKSMNGVKKMLDDYALRLWQNYRAASESGYNLTAWPGVVWAILAFLVNF